MTIRTMTDADVAGVVALWQRCGLTRPWNDPHADIAFARATATAEILVDADEAGIGGEIGAEIGGGIAGAVMVGHDGHRGTVYYLGVDPDRAGRGRGRALMAAAEDWLRARGVLKLNLLVRESNAAVVGFYTALGYGDQHCRVLGKRLDGHPDRTPPGRTLPGRTLPGRTLPDRREPER